MKGPGQKINKTCQAAVNNFEDKIRSKPQGKKLLEAAYQFQKEYEKIEVEFNKVFKSKDEKGPIYDFIEQQDNEAVINNPIFQKLNSLYDIFEKDMAECFDAYPEMNNTSFLGMACSQSDLRGFSLMFQPILIYEANQYKGVADAIHYRKNEERLDDKNIEDKRRRKRNIPKTPRGRSSLRNEVKFDDSGVLIKKPLENLEGF